MFIEQSVTPENKFWKYIVGSVLTFIAAIIGQIPLVIAVLGKSLLDNNAINLDEATLMKSLDSNMTLFLLLLSSAFVILGLYISVRFIHGQPFVKMITTRPKVDWRRISFSFFLWAFISVASTGVSMLTNPDDYVMNFKLVPFLTLVVISIIMVPIQTSSEEMIFRGYLMQGIGGVARNKWVPLILTSTIFGLLHIANPEVDKIGNIILVYYIGTGFLLGIMTLMDEGMELSLGFHAANNLVGALLVTSDWSVFQTSGGFKGRIRTFGRC